MLDDNDTRLAMGGAGTDPVMDGMNTDDLVVKTRDGAHTPAEITWWIHRTRPCCPCV